MAAAPNPEDVAKAFVQHYYTTFDKNRGAIGSLYQEASMMSFEDQRFVGASNIAGKLMSIPGDVEHVVKTIDVQPSVSSNAILVFVTGDVKIGGPNPMKFTQFFQLVATGPTSFYVHNDIMRLVYA